MKFFKPVVQLAREHQIDQPDLYFLHVVTFCPRTCYYASNYTVSTTNLANGLYEVTVKIMQDLTRPDMEYITPVVHTIDLGPIAFPGGEGWIQVSVEGDVPNTRNGATRDGNPTTKTKTGGSGTVSTTDADDKSRPILESSLV